MRGMALPASRLSFLLLSVPLHRVLPVPVVRRLVHLAAAVVLQRRAAGVLVAQSGWLWCPVGSVVVRIPVGPGSLVLLLAEGLTCLISLAREEVEPIWLAVGPRWMHWLPRLYHWAPLLRLGVVAAEVLVHCCTNL